MSHSDQDHVVVDDDDTPASLVSMPDSGDTGEGGKLKMIVQLVKKCLGVKDIASMRLSLPASLLEPIPNLEYWHYLDRPDYFAAINDAEFPFERMLAAVRFAFTKDLRHIHGKVCKPYNSVLGEHFRAHWDVSSVVYPDGQTVSPVIPTIDAPSNTSETASIKSGGSSKSTRSGFSAFSKVISPTPASSPPQSVEANVSAQMSNLSLGNSNHERLRVVFVTEQVSHHPPVSAYYVSCPQRHIELSGIDQISAKVSGTTVKVFSGHLNQGIFINVTGGFGEGERYHITHPAASINGLFRGCFYITVSESTIITCTGGKSGQKLRAIIEYKEESWLGKARFLVEGVIHTFQENETEHKEWTKVKHVPAERVVAVFDGSWRGHMRWRRAGPYPNVISSSASLPLPSHERLSTPYTPPHGASRTDLPHSDTEYATLIDLTTLQVIPKQVRPLEKQLPNESRNLWRNVTDKLMKKEYSEATKEKHVIEQRQRNEAAERKRKGVEFMPKYFERDYSAGYANLTEEGWKAVKEELEESLSPAN